MRMVKKNILSLFMVLVMVMTLPAMSANAEEGSQDNISQENEVETNTEEQNEDAVQEENNDELVVTETVAVDTQAAVMSVGETTITKLTVNAPINPITGKNPVVNFEEEQFTGTIDWTENPEVFDADKKYNVIITLTPKPGYTFDGVAENSIKIAGAYNVSNAAGSGVVNASFNTPPEGYVTDGHGHSAIKVGTDFDYAFDIKSNYNGRWIKTTYRNVGYRFKYKIAGKTECELKALNEDVTISDNVTMKVTPTFSSDYGRFVRVVFTLTNSSNEDITVSFGGHSDIQIDDDDHATVEVFDNGTGFKMINRNDTNMQFNFFGRNTLGVNNVDSIWFGHFYDRLKNQFSNTEESSLYGKDSGMTFAYQNRTIPAGQSRNYAILLGAGEASLVEEMSVGVTFDTVGGSIVPPVSVESVGDTIARPEAPTKSGYDFVDWYVDPEYSEVFDFATPITANITLYAKWKIHEGAVEPESPVEPAEPVAPTEPEVPEKPVIPSTSPQTGDNAQMGRYIMISGLALGMMISVIMKKRKSALK